MRKLHRRNGKSLDNRNVLTAKCEKSAKPEDSPTEEKEDLERPILRLIHAVWNEIVSLKPTSSPNNFNQYITEQRKILYNWEPPGLSNK